MLSLPIGQDSQDIQSRQSRQSAKTVETVSQDSLDSQDSQSRQSRQSELTARELRDEALGGNVLAADRGPRCRANLVHIRQSRPDSGLDLSHFQYSSL